MLIIYNAVTPVEDHALNAVRTAIGIQEAVNGRTFGKGATLKTRCGINTGDI
ncbi:MAG TPA: adenylate/guanylate cyclase domain-containing protein, partial [Rhodospirillales bacterium]|nr:adenylate/guanylate cyclase domain-containing protein [Rhodospirillales bacterium]